MIVVKYKVSLYFFVEFKLKGPYINASLFEGNCSVEERIVNEDYPFIESFLGVTLQKDPYWYLEGK